MKKHFEDDEQVTFLQKMEKVKESSFKAIEKEATTAPFSKRRISGSLPKLPIRITLFTVPFMKQIYIKITINFGLFFSKNFFLSSFWCLIYRNMKTFFKA